MDKYNEEIVLLWLSTNNARGYLVGHIMSNLKPLSEAIKNCNNLKCLLGLISTLEVTTHNKYKAGSNLEKIIINQCIIIISSCSDTKFLLEINTLFEYYENIADKVTSHANYPHEKIKSIEEKERLRTSIDQEDGNTGMAL